MQRVIHLVGVMNNSAYIVLVLFIFAYVLTAAGLCAWRSFRKTGAMVVPVTEKIRRQPGDALRKRIAQHDQRLIFHFLGVAIAPLLIIILALWLTSTFSPNAQFWTLIGLILPLLATLYFGAQWMNAIMQARDELLLNYYGERMVGDALDEIRFRGFNVYHNVPATEANPAFEIDHIIVGANGIYLIDTHTLARGIPRPGVDGHRIVFDGQQLVLPWGEDVARINHAREQTAWLENWIIQILGTKIPVMTVLVFPGWWVDEIAHGHVRVVNPKQIITLLGRNVQALNEEQMGTLCRELETRCRDIES